MKLYLSGPMRGRTDWNYPAFNATAMRLRGLGHDVINPAENFGGDSGRERHHYMRLDIQHVLGADAVAVLPGWQESQGARCEVLVAQELNLPIYDAETMRPVECYGVASFVYEK